MTMPVKRLCPACAVRRGMLIDQNCIICHGQGLLTLGPAALAVCPARTVAVAVTLALESVARETDRKTTLSDNRITPLVKAVELLEKGGILASSHPTRQLARSVQTDTAQSMANSVTGLRSEPLDLTLSEAPPYRYDVYDRPNARGLPVLSAGGFASHFARLVDPATPGGETAHEVQTRNIEELRAGVLLAAVPEALEIKKKRRRK